jgi:PIN domain nuclease of toxin-antitoxin system
MILLDTHIVLWLGYFPDKLSAAAVEAIGHERKGSGLAVSDKTLWELAMIADRGRLDLPQALPMRDLLSFVELHCRILPITAAIAERSMGFGPAFPRDPTDQIIAATAIVHGIKLTTADRLILRSGEVDCIW